MTATDPGPHNFTGLRIMKHFMGRLQLVGVNFFGVIMVVMIVFIVILFVGYIYVWKKGAFEWE